MNSIRSNQKENELKKSTHKKYILKKNVNLNSSMISEIDKMDLTKVKEAM